MLRWCRWTFRTPDGRTTRSRWFSSTPFLTYHHTTASRSAAQSLRLLVPVSHHDTQPSLTSATTSSRTRSLTKASDPGPSALSQTPTYPGDSTTTGTPVSPFPFTLDDARRTSLFRLLSLAATDHAALLLTPHTVYSRYEEVKRVHGPSHFTNKHFTVLINLFGNAACKESEQACASASTASWRRVLRIGGDKRDAGHPLITQDHYWLMRACITEAVTVQSATQLQFVEGAVEHCSHLLAHQDPNVQFIALSALFASPAFTDTLHELALDPPLSDKVTHLFWALVQRGSSLDSRFRARLCALAVGNSQRRRMLKTELPVRTLNVCDIAHTITSYIGFSTTLPPTNPDIHSWVRQQVVDTLGSRIDPVARWHHLRQAGGFIEPEPIPELTKSMMSPSWRTIFGLVSLGYHPPAPDEIYVRILALWDVWTTECTRYAPNRIIAQIVTSTIFRMAAGIPVPDAFSLFAPFCKIAKLWKLPQHASRFDHAQALDSILAFISSQAGLVPWTDLFDFVTEHSSHLKWREVVTNELLQQYTTTDPQLAHSLVRFAIRHSTPLPLPSLLALAECLAGQRQWLLLRPLLAPSYDFDQTERLVQCCLRTIQTNRLEKLNDVVAQWLLRRIATLYHNRQLPSSMKYPLRYFFGAAIKSGFAFETVSLVRSTCSAFPSLFSPGLARRLVLYLLDLGHRNLSFQLYVFFSSIFPRPAVEDIRRKVSHRLIAKSRKFAPRYTVRRPPYQPESSNLRQRRTRLLRKHVPSATKLCPDAIASQDINALRQSVSLLVREKRLYAARKVLSRMCKRIKPKDCTTLGNIILHGSLLQYRHHGRHRVRHVLNTKAFLEEHCHFVMDRATINILLKAMLQWIEYFDAQRARFLFDQLVHEGYPIPDRFRDGRPHGVPFGHAHDASLWSGGQGSPSTPSIFSKLSPCVSFPRHMRPMLKMFIKAFYIRKDIVAAKTIVGILKDAEATERAEREKRNRARREGIIKKRLKTMHAQSRGSRESESSRPE